ncbi:hypothetical protein HK413_06735 [Mucilaginibacter sp. S1162]|uniref:Uncharacterized protein n=1 Tax=Mucilaginibacter humi TaxID=2732510 RepID=A0ABX1W3T1_9SPHI|nr:hypothetical protein [Mucilaginibacter humi]NNU33919.1 hypothetical protein [Mucilaginibacter humi]
MIKAIAELDHYSQFTHIHPVAKIQKSGRREKIAGTIARGKYDILLMIDDGKTDIASFRSIAANYIIVCQLTPADENYLTYSTRHGRLITAILRSFSASGLLFFPIDRDPMAVLAWYRSFIRSLTENATILKAIQATVKEGYLIQIPATATDQPLEKGLAFLAGRFKKLYDQNYPQLGNAKKTRNCGGSSMKLKP